MRKIYTIVSFMALSVASFAQAQFENPGFETWDNVSANNREPQQWNSIKTGSSNAQTPNGFVIDRSGVTRPGTSGSYSVLCETKTLLAVIFNVDVNGILTNGRVEAPTTTPADGYNRTKPDDEQFKTSFTDYPDTLVAWVNYQPVGSDNGRVQCIVHNVDGTGLNAGDMGSLPENGTSQGNNVPQTIAKAQFDLTANTSGWTRLAIPFNYANGNVPEYILLTATSSIVPGGGEPGSKLYVDDLGLIYNITPTLSSNAAYVTATDNYSLSVDYSTGGTPTAATDFTVELSDATGDFTNATVIGSLNTSAASGTIACTVPAGTTDGTGYRIRVVNASEYYASVAVPFTVYNLFANAVPGATQNIVVNVASSTDITADAHSEAIAYDWQFATASGGPYTSFSPAEAGISYTPLFTATGTYYVVCEVDFGAMELLTNEVEINVDVATGIDEPGTASIPVYNANGQVFIDLRGMELNVPTFDLYNLSGQVVATGSLVAGSINALPNLNSGIYAIRILHADGMFTSKVFVN